MMPERVRRVEGRYSRAGAEGSMVARCTRPVPPHVTRTAPVIITKLTVDDIKRFKYLLLRFVNQRFDISCRADMDFLAALYSECHLPHPPAGTIRYGQT
jgi:hypothetical protein